MILGAPCYAYAKTVTCEASWYGPGFQGKKMANGKPFDMDDADIVAHKTYEFGTALRITNLDNGKSITAVVQDRGPFIEGRCVDLSKAGALKLGFTGTANVSVTKL